MFLMGSKFIGAVFRKTFTAKFSTDAIAIKDNDLCVIPHTFKIPQSGCSLTFG